MFFYLKSVNPAGHLLERHSVLMKEAGEGDVLRRSGVHSRGCWDECIMGSFAV